MAYLIELFERILSDEAKKIIIVIDNKGNPWFYAKQIADILEYKNTRTTIKKGILSKNKILYENIKEYSCSKHNIQDNTIFINETGLYELILKSKMKKSIKFKNWIVEEVLPTIRRTGKYVIEKKYKSKLEKIKSELNKYKQKVNILENNQRKEKYPDGGYVYIVKPNNIDDDLYKIGINTFNTSLPDKINVIGKFRVDSPNAVEHCLKAILYKYRYINKKEYYRMKYDDLVKKIEKCIRFIEGKKVKSKLSRHTKSIDQSKKDIYEIIIKRTNESI